MELFIRGNMIHIDEPSAESIIETMNEHLEDGYFFSHFVADGEEIYNNHEQYLLEHAQTIQKLEIITKTVEQFTNDLLISAEQYINGATPEIETLVDEFYKSPTEATWHRFVQLLEGIQWLQQMITSIGNIDGQPDNYPAYVAIATTMQEQLTELEEAMQNEDNVLVGDLIQYEITPLFEKLQSEITATIDKEGYRYEAN